MSDKRYTRVEEEVIEILDRLEHEGPAPARPNLRLVSSRPARKRRFDGLRRKLPARLPRVNGVAIVVLVIVGLFALQMVNLPNFVAILLILGIIGFFLWGMLRGGSRSSSGPGYGPPGTKTWRGRDISFGPDPGDSPAERIARRFRKPGPPRR